MTALSLFPARIRFVNDDGTLTPEAYRALQEIVNRTGGVLGNSGQDTFGNFVSGASESQSITSDVMATPQSANEAATLEMVTQGVSVDIGYALEMVSQPMSTDSGQFVNITYSGLLTGGKVSLNAGTVGLPSLYFGADTTTGFYRIGANNYGFSVSGVKVLDIASTGLSVTGSTSTSGSFRATFGTTTGFAASTLLMQPEDTTNTRIYACGPDTSTYGAFGLYVAKSNGSPLQVLGGTAAGQLTAPNGFAATGAASCTGVFTATGGISTGSSTLHSTSAALANGAAAAAGTLTNAPAAGNPTKWVPINDNGTTRYIPCW